MTLNDIIAAALVQLGRGHDTRTMEACREKFTLYANDAVNDLATAFRFCRTEAVRVNGSTIDTAKFDRPCLKLIAISQDGFPIKYSLCEAAGIASVRGMGMVDVTYRYMPKELSRPADVPEVPKHLHGLIVSYVVARERISGDKSTQGGGDIYLQIYETGKSRMLSACEANHDIINAL